MTTHEERCTQLAVCQVEKQYDPSGQAAVEIALLLPALVILLFGIILSGFSLYAFIQVSNAAREGARAGSLYRITQSTSGLTLDQTVKYAIYDTRPVTPTSALGFLSPTPPSFNVNNSVVILSSGSLSDPNQGDQLTVQLTYSYTVPIVSSFVPMFPRPMVIHRSVMMEMQ